MITGTALISQEPRGVHILIEKIGNLTGTSIESPMKSQKFNKNFKNRF